MILFAVCMIDSYCHICK